ncbi:MAG: tripartite tricarboxylate transporter substrate binding protein [Candidatus Rokubacteria bacterium]|nr:tripartite tricarboxylate transporter substrate binding protein [Candidatus Rokubacteria bacterium]
MTRASRFGVLLAVVLGLIGADTGLAIAQEYPSRPIQLIVPFAPGGGSDIIARIISPHLGKLLGQPVVIDNRPGAGATIGANVVAKAAPDGYTLLYVTPGVQLTNPYLMKKLPYDPVSDFAPILPLVVVPNVLVVHPSVPVKSVKDLIELARAKPGTLNFSSSGIGSSSHLSGELFKQMTATRMTHIAYKGTGASLQDLLTGNVQLAFESLNVMLPHIKAGALRAIAVTTPERSPVLPDLPPIADTLPGFDAAAFNYVSARAGTPRPVIERLNRELNAVLKIPEVRDRFLSLGVTSIGGTPEDLDARIKRESLKWKRVIEVSGARPE